MFSKFLPLHVLYGQHHVTSFKDICFPSICFLLIAFLVFQINALMQVRIGATIEEKWGCTEKNFSHDDAFACVRDAE